MVSYAYMCCVCVFLLRQESPDMILGDKPLISEVVLPRDPRTADDIFGAVDLILECVKDAYDSGHNPCD
jgi:hypothetical protein